MKISMSWLWRMLSLFLSLTLILSPAFAAAGVKAQEPGPEPRTLAEALARGLVSGPKIAKEPVVHGSIEKQAPVVEQPLKTETEDSALAKLHPDLREAYRNNLPAVTGQALLAQGAPQGVLVRAVLRLTEKEQETLAQTQYSRLFVSGKFIAQPPIEFKDYRLQFVTGQVLPSGLVKLAALDSVWTVLPVVLEMNGSPDDMPIDEERQLEVKGPEDWAALRAGAEALRSGTPDWQDAKAFGDGRELMLPQDWFEVSLDGPHKAQAAWDRGYTGEGVSVAVNDDGVDFAHPDLMGTQKIYQSNQAPQYNGWPMVFSPFSQFLFANDYYLGTSYTANGYPSSHYVDTSTTPALSPCGAGVRCFNFTPLIDYGTPGYEHTYVISTTMSQSGVAHLGTHPDNDLRDYVWGEKVAVLVADPNTAGVYDTVYIDMDDDYDFRDEKPLTRADTTDAASLEATKNNMIAYRDLNGDGLADISGGMVYFIADGVSSVPVSDWYWGIPAPSNGDLVAISGSTFDRAYSHGTQCASNVAGQGVVNALLPEFSDLPPGPGTPAGAVLGMAPDAEVVNVSDIYYDHDNSKLDAYLFAAIGYDGYESAHPSDTDAIQVTTNSYGASIQDNDGWEYDGQFVTDVQNSLAPYTQYLFSTGNGAPGYGTTAPPTPATGIAVGASTEFGSTGWDSITSTLQIMQNDVINFSNRGPSARGTNGVDVVAGGAYAAGDEELNYYAISTWGEYNGNLSWVSWGGTSRSAPTAGGVLALLYQAYKSAHGVWPDYQTAKELFMASATDLNYDTFTQGAGSVNADTGSALAAGLHGASVTPAEWNPGDYRGTNYPYFAHLTFPGETWNTTFGVNNWSAAPLSVTASDQELLLVDSVSFDFTVTPEMFAAKPPDNFYKAPQFIIPLTAAPGKMSANPWWDNVTVPAGADLMVVRMRLPYEQYDADGDYSWDNRFRLMVYSWNDVNGDNNVWSDANGNNVVDFTTVDDVTLIDYGSELDWPSAEIDHWEYGRYGYSRPGSANYEITVHNPLERMQDGLFIGLQQYDASWVEETDLSFQVDFYTKSDVPWLSTGWSASTLPAGGSVPLPATVSVPADMQPGLYQAAIQVEVPASGPYAGNTIVVPVVLNVGTVFDFDQALELGGDAANSADAARPYNNGAVKGSFDWTWRAESGDWRFFSMDVRFPTAPISTTFLTENFDSVAAPALPSGWANVSVFWPSGTEPKWATAVGTVHPSGGGAHSAPNLAYFNSYSTVDPKSARLYTTSGLDLSQASEARVSFWMYHDAGYAGQHDSVQVQVSTNGGSSWTNVGTAVIRDDGTTGWGQHIVDLSAYLGLADVRLGFLGISAFGNDCHIDDIVVSGEVEQPAISNAGKHILIKDEWADATPHTDIDTVVLGPTDSEFAGPDFGPYTLDTVASSPNTNISDGVWLFDTSSGANEDWVSVPLQEGLHQVLQHNVLFEGDQFWAPFTKTVGLLTEDVWELEIETYADKGPVGNVTLTSTLALNGLEAQAFLVAPDVTEWTDEPLDFTGAGSIEWIYEFDVADGVDIEAWTSSADISDLDLFLYYCDAAGCSQMDASTSGTSDEYVSLANPPDGGYLLAIDNYSGPAGAFDLTLVVRSRVPGLSVSGLPAGEVPADSPVTLTVDYDYPFEPGETYEGLVFLGPPEAPQLKEIPITIHRLQGGASIEKTVDFATHFPGDEVQYTINLYNHSMDPAPEGQMVDPIPDGTQFVSVSGATYEAGNNRIVYDGPLPGMTVWGEGFEGGVVPPAGWSEETTNASYNWHASTSAYQGSYSAEVLYDPSMAPQDEWLIGSELNLKDRTLSVWSMGSYYWGVSPNDNYDLEAWIVVGPTAGDADDIFLAKLDEDWPTTNWTWTNSVFNLASYGLPDEPVRAAFRYVGADGAQANIDSITSDVPTALPHSVELTVQVEDTVVEGQVITNTAMLSLSHDLPQGMQLEQADSASAVFQIGSADLSESYKEGPQNADVGDIIEYTLHLTNSGEKLVQDLSLVDPIPAGMIYYNHIPGLGANTFNYNSALDQMEWTGNLAPGGTIDLVYWVEVVEPGRYTNTAALSWGAGQSMQLSAQTTVWTYYYLPMVTQP